MIATDDARIAFISPGCYTVCFRLTYRPNINNSKPNQCNLPSISNPTCIACNDAKFALMGPGYKINSSAHSTNLKHHTYGSLDVVYHLARIQLSIAMNDAIFFPILLNTNAALLTRYTGLGLPDILFYPDMSSFE